MNQGKFNVSFRRSGQTETLSRNFNVRPKLAISRIFIIKSVNPTPMDLAVRPVLDNLSGTLAVSGKNDFQKTLRGDLRQNISDQINFEEDDHPKPALMEQKIGGVFTNEIDRKPEFKLSAVRKAALNKLWLSLYGTIDNLLTKSTFGDAHRLDQNGNLKILEIFKQTEESASDFDVRLKVTLFRKNMKSNRASKFQDAKLDDNIWDIGSQKSSSDVDLEKVHESNDRKQNHRWSFANVMILTLFYLGLLFWTFYLGGVIFALPIKSML